MNLQLPGGWHEIAETGAKEWNRLKSLRKKPPDSALERIADYLDLTPDLLSSGTLDIQALARQRLGNVTYLPERYRPGALSTRRTSSHLLDSIELRWGWRARQQLLRKLQMTGASRRDLSAPINILFLADVCEQLLAWGATPLELSEMGRQSTISYFHSPLGDEFRKSRSATEVMEIAVSLAPRFFDRNFVYRLIRLNEQVAVLEASPSEEARTAIPTHQIGSSGTCAARAGIISSFFNYKLLPAAPIEEVRCIHRGDPKCIYKIDLREVSERSRAEKSR